VASPTQGAAACARPLTPRYVPNEAACACSILCNCVTHLLPNAHASTAAASSVAAAAALHELCAGGALPAALRALLHERSALLRATAEDAEALPPVIDLAARLVTFSPAARAALLLADGGGGELLLLLFAVSKYHPHARSTAAEDGAAAAAAAPRDEQRSAVAHALRFHAALRGVQVNGDADGAVTHAIDALYTRLGIDVEAAMDVVTAAQFAAGKRLAAQLGWEPPLRDGSASRGGSGTVPEEAAARRVRIATSCNPRAAGEGDCTGCGRMRRTGEGAFAKCARCKAAPYCSKACQAAHWKTHKKACKAAPGAA
jgi:hypothetical protein